MTAQPTFVIKYGGAAMLSDKLRESFIDDVEYLRRSGTNIVIVHGGGNDITSLAQRLGLETVFVDGLRYTDREMMTVVQMVLAGKTNKDIVAAMNRRGLNAMGLSGVDLSLITAERASPGGNDIGYVGAITSINAEPLNLFIERGIVPVVAPIGVNKEGEIFNINADHAAASIAENLRAAKLIYLSNIEGINVNGRVAHQITSEESEQLIKAQIIDKGMIPKVRSAFSALKNHVQAVYIVDGRNENALRSVLSDKQTSGTKLIL